MIDLLVVSHACFTAINRKVYQLFHQDGWTIEIVAPETLTFSSGLRKADSQTPEDPNIHFLKLVGTNPRIYYFEGLKSVLDERKPKIIFLESDPVSKMAFSIGQWCKANNSYLYCLSCENLPLDLVSTFKRRGWKNMPAALYKRYLLYRTRSLISGVFCINSDGKNIFIKEGYKNVERIPLGFDPKIFNVDLAKREQIRIQHQLTKTTVAYFGRLTREKGIHILLRALANLKEYEWQLVMDSFDVYASDYASEVHNLLIQLDIKERVVFVNPNHYQIAGYMNAVDIVVVPSVTTPNWKEQYGRVAAEAMACGRLVIASNSGSLPELLGGYGLLFEEGSVEELSQILKTFLLEKQLPSLGMAQEVAEYALQSLSICQQKVGMESLFKNGITR